MRSTRLLGAALAAGLVLASGGTAAADTGLVTSASGNGTQSVRADAGSLPLTFSYHGAGADTVDVDVVRPNGRDARSSVDPESVAFTGAGQATVVLTIDERDCEAGGLLKVEYVARGGRGRSDQAFTNVHLTGCDDAGEEPEVPAEDEDTTPPVIDVAVDGPLGTGGWYTGDVTVDWTATDAESAVTASGCDDVTVTGDTAGTTFTCTATSEGGTSTRSVTVKRDASAPTVTPTTTGPQGAAGWFTGPVTVAWATADDVSGATTCETAVVAADTTGTDVTCTSTNGAGLSTTATVTVKVDGTVPTVTWAGPTTYDVDQALALTCATADATSGIATSTCTPVTGGAFQLLATGGAGSATASATDVAGNTASATAAYRLVPTVDGSCRYIKQVVTNAGVANSLCVKLRNAAAARTRGQIGAAANVLDAFRQEVRAQAGKHIVAGGDRWLLLLADRF